jgi:hypothetical protein
MPRRPAVAGLRFLSERQRDPVSRAHGILVTANGRPARIAWSPQGFWVRRNFPADPAMVHILPVAPGPSIRLSFPRILMQFRLRDYFSPLQVFAHHRRMREAPFWSPERLDAWSRPRRKGLIAHAYTHVPYYRRLLDEHGIDPTRVDRDEVWRRIPLLTKDILREHAGDLTATSRFSRGAVWAGTSGSTASPLRFLLDRRVNAAAFALFWRAWSSGGHWRLGRPLAAGAAAGGTQRPESPRWLAISPGDPDPGDVVGPSGPGNGTPVSRSLGALPSAFPARLPLIHVPLLPAAAR